jgi:hypothetical protein
MPEICRYFIVSDTSNGRWEGIRVRHVCPPKVEASTNGRQLVSDPYSLPPTIAGV